MKNDFLKKRLQVREEQELLRKLSLPNNLIDFSSNDYLGFARSVDLQKLVSEELSTFNFQLSTGFGSTGSRLLTGNSQYAEELETFIAKYHKAEAGLIFNSGYTANVGLISSVARKEDVIFYDELSHASIYDGIRLSKAESFPFRHNDLNHLEERLKFFQSERKENSNYYIIVESVYSMDGDFAPLIELVSLCEDYNVNLIVDEAHATGIFGKKGEAKVVELGLEQKVFARVHAFGKALGCHGAIVLGSESLRNYLINFSRPFIYTTALPIHTLVSIKSAYKLLSISNEGISKINGLIKLFREKIHNSGLNNFLNSFSSIQSVILEGNENVKKISLLIQKDGFDVRPILSPTVPKGKERLRICLHSFNSEDEINGLLLSLKKNLELDLKKYLAV